MDVPDGCTEAEAYLLAQLNMTACVLNHYQGGDMASRIRDNAHHAAALIRRRLATPHVLDRIANTRGVWHEDDVVVLGPFPGMVEHADTTR